MPVPVRTPLTTSILGSGSSTTGPLRVLMPVLAPKIHSVPEVERCRSVAGVDVRTCAYDSLRAGGRALQVRFGACPRRTLFWRSKGTVTRTPRAIGY